MEMIDYVLEQAERRGYGVGRHPNGTLIVKNFREYLVVFPGTLAYEVREPLISTYRSGVIETREGADFLLEALK